MKRLIAFFSMLLFSQSINSGSVIGSRHDLSTPTTPQVCEFCHTPHSANTNLAGGWMLWNRAETRQIFTLYGSPTMNTSPAQPGSAVPGNPGSPSRLCLSCHDGVLAYIMVNGNLVSTQHDLVKPPGHPAPDMTSYPNCERCHVDMYGGRRTLVLGTDLRNDHPIAMAYPTSGQDPAFKTPADPLKGWGGTSQNDVKLYAGSVECGSCHNVHNPDVTPFLRKSNAVSALCLTCHKK